MHLVNIAVVLGCLSSSALAGYSQYFYRTGFEPFQQHYFRQSYPAFQQVYNPIPQYFAPRPILAYQHAIPQAPVQVQDSNEVQGRSDATPSLPQDKFNYERKESSNFRGFAYHTELDNGARSNVIFITGPEAHKYQLPTMNQDSNTPASDAVDSNAPKEDTESVEVNSPISALVRFLENPQVGVQKFYSIDNTLVARRLEDDYIGYPASTLPLQAPISPLYSILRANFNNPIVPNLGSRSATEKSEVQNEPIGAASETKSNTLESVVSTTTTSSTTAPVTTTTTIPTTTASTTEIQPSTTTTEITTSSKSTMEPIVVEETTDENKVSTASR